ncbi:MAG: glycosyltransferase [Eubacteriales bacterium]|nr:glycosyltransferase [Eubacteriales bacterium]
MILELQSILHPRREVCEVEELYIHRDGYRSLYDGFFNLFYIEKRKKYTDIPNLCLQLEGAPGTRVTICHNDDEIGEAVIPDTGSLRTELPYSSFEDGYFWFYAELGERDIKSKEHIDKGTASADHSIITGYYYTDIDDTAVRSVRIGIDICTFRREQYVCRNLTQLKQDIIDKTSLAVSDNIDIYIIDNGQTLQDNKKFTELISESGGRIQVIPNKNAGGTGGFTRGMIEILKHKEDKHYTHVLVMDDDAVVEPDAIVRTYGLLATLREEWKDVIIGGSLIREDIPYILSCYGEIWRDGFIDNPNMNTDLRSREAAASDALMQPKDEHDRYSGWWYCCMSLKAVREDNLPLPLFIHHDDIEYGLRNIDNGCIFMNGIGVWHKSFDQAFAGANIYYDIRNNLIELSLHSEEQGVLRKAVYLIFKAMTVALMRYNYNEVDIVYRGLNDYMKGLKWLYRQEPDVLNNKVRAMALKFSPAEDIRKDLSPEETEALNSALKEYRDGLDQDTLVSFYNDKKKISHREMLTLNGFLKPAHRDLSIVFPMNRLRDIYGSKRILMYEPAGNRAVIQRKDYREFFRCMGLTVKAVIKTVIGFNRAAADCRKAAREITNMASWERYLYR